MAEIKGYKEYIAKNYNKLVIDFCDENSGEFETYCNGESHIMEEFAENNSDFEEYCREAFFDSE